MKRQRDNRVNVCNFKLFIFRVKKESMKSINPFGTDLLELFNTTNERGKRDLIIFVRSILSLLNMPWLKNESFTFLLVLTSNYFFNKNDAK